MDVSIIFPVKNLGQKLSEMIPYISSQITSFSSELIIVDMGSSDATVATALRLLRQEGLTGCVIQNGEVTPAEALNSGIHKAKGKYISFLFARRLYSGVLSEYYHTAEHTDADLVFGSMTEAESRTAERQSMSRVVKKKQGVDYMKACLEGKLYLDIAALLLRRQFLLENQIWFVQECRYGYAEEFLYRCLMRGKEIVPSPVMLKRERGLELTGPSPVPVGKEIFQETEAMLRVQDILWCEHSQENDLMELLTCQRIPAAVMHGIDVLLRNGYSHSMVRAEMKKLSYEKLLKIGRYTSADLKKKIRHWKSFWHHYFPSQL